MGRIITWSTRSWHPLAVIAVWVALAALPFVGPKLSAHTSNNAQQLPASAPAQHAQNVLDKAFPQADGTGIVVAYGAAAPLSAPQRAAVQAGARYLNTGNVGLVGKPIVQYSPDRKAAIIAAVLSGDPGQTRYRDNVTAIQDHLSAQGSGMAVHVTGVGGLGSDSYKIFASLDTKLLAGSVAIVLILLLLVYRSPILPLVALLTVGIAYSVATGLLGLSASVLHYTVNKIAISLMIVLLFGAGTDYALLLISRYREYLHSETEPRRALALGLLGTWEAIAASGITVVLAILSFSFASLPTFSSFAPVIAAGVAVTFIAALTLIPALLALLGRAAFWPRIPRVGQALKHGAWQRVAQAVVGRPWRAVLSTVAVLGVLALGLVAYTPTLNFIDNFLQSTPATQGYKLVQQHFPAGTLAPTQVVATYRKPLTQAQTGALLAAMTGAPNVRSAFPAAAADGGRVVEYQVILKSDPYGKTSINDIAALSSRVGAAAAATGGTAVVAGASALSHDLYHLSNRDTVVVGVIALLVTALVLGLLLRSLVAPLLLLATNLLSFAAATGAVIVITRYLFGWDSFGFQVPLYMFIFLIALGSDYNIFISTRIRAESFKRGLRDGTERAVAVTGGVLTSAGLVLAGTFLILAAEPVKYLVEVGLGVAIGVLLDTFIVRSALVPGLITAVGARIGWPGRRWECAEECPVPPDERARERAGRLGAARPQAELGVSTRSR
jgi:putative drug exporter of the RND superfamily